MTLHSSLHYVCTVQGTWQGHTSVAYFKSQNTVTVYFCGRVVGNDFSAVVMLSLDGE